MSNNMVITFSLIGGTGTFLSAIYYTVRAYRSKTGPMISANKYMPDYSGHFEMDMLPVFVNLITTIQYIGETLETIENQIGFFNQYRYGSYLITCPLMVYETVHTIGAPYATTMFSLTLVTILTAIFADLAPDASQRWTWFGFGCTLNVMFCVMLLKVVKHAHRLNDGLCSDKQMKDSIKQLGYDAENFPKGIMRLRTPMDEKRMFIDGAFSLMFFLWPIFPIMFVLEYTGCIDRNMTQIVFALTDLIIKTSHSFCLDQYKQGLRHTVFSYGFLDTSILYELHIWDTDQDVYTQLKALSRSMYGDLLVGKKGQLTDIESAGIDYQSMLTANRLNRKVDSFEEESSSEPKSPTLVRRMSSAKVGFAKSTSFRVEPEPSPSPSGSPKQTETRTPHSTMTSDFNQHRDLRLTPHSPGTNNHRELRLSMNQQQRDILTSMETNSQRAHSSQDQYPPRDKRPTPRNESNSSDQFNIPPRNESIQSNSSDKFNVPHTNQPNYTNQLNAQSINPSNVQPINPSTVQPTNQYNVQPINQYNVQPANQYNVQPANQYNVQPINPSNVQPTNQYNVQPTNQYNVQPTNQYNVQPTNQYNVQPTNQSNVQPTNQSIVQPTNQSNVQPTNQSNVQLINQSNYRARINSQPRDDSNPVVRRINVQPIEKINQLNPVSEPYQHTPIDYMQPTPSEIRNQQPELIWH